MPIEFEMTAGPVLSGSLHSAAQGWSSRTVTKIGHVFHCEYLCCIEIPWQNGKTHLGDGKLAIEGWLKISLYGERAFVSGVIAAFALGQNLTRSAWISQAFRAAG
jgi:hypothetical protein